MDMLLVSDEGSIDAWNPIDRMGAKRKQWPQDGCNNNKMKKLNGVSINPWDQVEELTVDLDSTCSLSGLNVDLTTSTFSNSNTDSGEQTSPPRCKPKPTFPTGRNIDYNNHSSPPAPSIDKNLTSVDNNVVTSAPATSTVKVSPDESRGPFTPESSPINTEFQYVLAAPTSIATKVGDETLTYLNQGQPYEIKLKKLGDLSEYRGKILKSVIRLSFHERRLQYMEREQMAAWEASHPGDSILEVDLPLSYGIFDIHQDHNHLNAVEFLWDPTKEGGVYIKVNCISTEFTPKKHGGEKGVPFRIQVETYLHDDNIIRRLHAASCQVKVFKLKGADRKHKQDREKILKRPIIEQEKYQCSYEVTILTDVPVSNDFDYTPAISVPPQIASSELNICRPIVSSTNVPKEEPSPQQEIISPPDSPAQTETNCSPRADWGPAETSLWLQANRYTGHHNSLASYSGADLLRLSREDLIQLCGLSDGIRLFNALHVRTVAPKLTIYVCVDPRDRVYNVVYLTSLKPGELLRKVCYAVGLPVNQVTQIYLLGPGDIKILPTEELVSHLPDNTAYSVTLISDGQEKYQVLLKQSETTNTTNN
nr:transcription factor CP2 isoform X2 [Halyomorpha halys]